MVAPLPHFDAEACSLGRLTCADCADCAEAYPTAALSLRDDGLDLAPSACTACGACVSTCPQRAVSLSGLKPVVTPNRRGEAALICPEHALKAQICLQAIGMQALAALWIAGLRLLHLGLGGCETCRNGVGLTFSDRLNDFNAFLEDHNLSPMLVVTGASHDLRRLSRLGAQDDRPDPSRRALFGVRLANLTESKQPGLAQPQAVKAKGRMSPRFAFAPQVDPLLWHRLQRLHPHLS